MLKNFEIYQSQANEERNEKALNLKEAKVAWIVPVLGVLGKILYTKPLLASLADRCGAFKVFTTEFKGDKTGLGFEVERSGTLKRLYPNERLVDSGSETYAGGFSLVTPAIVPALLKYQPDLIGVNEFSLLSLYTVLVRWMMPGVRILLLVEARPKVNQSEWFGSLRQALRAFIVKSADAILTNNADGRNYLVVGLHASSNKIMVSPYLVSDMASMAKLSREKLLDRRLAQAKEFPLRFLYVGQLLRQKGLHYALEALAGLLPQYQGQFIFDVVGEGPFKEKLEHQVQELDLSGHVIFHGRQPYISLWQWYLQAHVFLFPTLSDYRALAPFEALSMGLPIAASLYDGGVDETVDPGHNGFSFDPRDTPNLTRILARFLDVPEMIGELSKRSMKMAEAYTLERATDTLANACQITLTSSPSDFSWTPDV